MASARFAWGIDIGNRALKAIKLVREGDALRIDDVEVIEHEQVLSNSGDNRESLIQTALANFAQRHQTKGGVVAIGVSGQASFARFIKLPPVEKNKIPEIVRFEAIQQIPFPLDQVEWSYQLFEQPDSPDVEVGIFAMRKELVNQQIKYFADMDMDVQVVQMSPLAVYNAMYHDQRLADGTTMILDLGAENADLIIADGESVWLRSVPIGGNNFTEALVKAFKLNFTKAEDLKRNAQTSKYARQIFQAMRPIFADLVAEIQRSIGFYSSVHRDSRIKRIVALGNTFRLPTLQKYLQQNLQIDVERLDGFNGGAPDDGRLAAVLSDNIASMAGAYGLALQAMGQGKIESSLLPREIKVAKIWREKTKWFAMAAAIMLAGAGVKYGMYYVNHDKWVAAQPVQQQVDAVIRQAKTADSDWAGIESSGGADKTRITNVFNLTKYRNVWGDFWVDLVRSLPAANAKGPAELAGVARDARDQVFVESVNARYEPDIGPALAADVEAFKRNAQASSERVDMAAASNVPTAGAATGGAGGYRPPAWQSQSQRPTRTTRDGEEAPAGPTKRGYFVTIRLTSPYRDGAALVDSTVIKKLVDGGTEAQALKAGKNYFVPRAVVVSARRIKDDPERMTAIKAAYDQKKAAAEKTIPLEDRTGGGGGRVDLAPRAPAALNPEEIVPNPNQLDEAERKKQEEAAPFVDPLFPNETVLNDWAVTVLVAVVLDPAPPAPTEGGSTADAAPAPGVGPADRRLTASR